MPKENNPIQHLQQVLRLLDALGYQLAGSIVTKEAQPYTEADLEEADLERMKFSDYGQMVPLVPYHPFEDQQDFQNEHDYDLAMTAQQRRVRGEQQVQVANCMEVIREILQGLERSGKGDIADFL